MKCVYLNFKPYNWKYYAVISHTKYILLGNVCFYVT